MTIQEANAIAVLDLSLNEFTEIIGLGAKDLSMPGNEFDPKDNDGKVEFINVNARGLSMPDGVASYKWRSGTYLVLANEGDFSEDNVNRSAAGGAPYSAPAPLDRLRISNEDSSPGNLYAAGARSMSMRNAEGTVMYNSGGILDTEAHERGVYDDGRSRDKGVEPEGVALLDIAGRTYAFVGLERTTSATVAVYDMTGPNEVKFMDMIVTPGDLSPEGMAAFEFRGNIYLAIANEVTRERRDDDQYDSLPGGSNEALHRCQTAMRDLLSPPRFSGRQMRADDVRIQLDAQPGLVRHLDEAVLDVRAVEQQHLIHPAAFAGDRLERHVIADRRGPLRRRRRCGPGCRCCDSPSAVRRCAPCRRCAWSRGSRRSCAGRDAGCRSPDSG